MSWTVLCRIRGPIIRGLGTSTVEWIRNRWTRLQTRSPNRPTWYDSITCEECPATVSRKTQELTGAERKLNNNITKFKLFSATATLTDVAIRARPNQMFDMQRLLIF